MEFDAGLGEPFVLDGLKCVARRAALPGLAHDLDFKLFCMKTDHHTKVLGVSREYFLTNCSRITEVYENVPLVK